MLDKIKVEEFFKLLKKARLSVYCSHENGGCSDVDTVEELIDILAPALGPAVGSVWCNAKQVENMMCYTVLSITNTAHRHKDHPPQVVYQGDNEQVWSAPLKGWPHKLVALGDCSC